MTEERGATVVLGPRQEAIRLQERLDLTRPGVHRTQFFYSYSGAILVEGALPPLGASIDGCDVHVEPPLRLGSPSFRPTPQLGFENIHRFLKAEIPTPFPLQVGTFPGVSTSEGAQANCWFGPSDSLPPNAPILPPDTFLITLFGPDSPNGREKIEHLILEPLLGWLRVLTEQWWLGRSIEGASGPLHFIIPLNEVGQVVGSPTPTARFTSGGPKMKPVTRDIWIAAAHRAFSAERPPPEKTLESDANFMLASREFRSGIILACSAIEAGRDSLLTKSGARIAHLKTSTTDLLKHLSVGFERLFGINLRQADPGLFDILSAFWTARGHAAHGKPVLWRMVGSEVPIEDVSFATISDGLARVLEWIEAIPGQTARSAPPPKRPMNAA